MANFGGGNLSYKAKQLKSVTLAIYSKNPPSSAWAASSPTTETFAELSRAASLLGAYRSGPARV